MHLLLDILRLCGGVLGLDRTAAGQFMISQPIVAGPLIGWMLGDTTAGLVIGAVLELIWVLDMPVGTFVPADSTVGAVSQRHCGPRGGDTRRRPDRLQRSPDDGDGAVTMAVDETIRKCNSRLADRAASAPGEDAEKKLSRAHLTGLAVFFLKSFVYLVFIPAGLFAVSLFAHMPEKAHNALALFVKLLPLLGAALVVRKLSIRNLDRFFLAGFAVAALLTLVFRLHPLIIIPLVITAGYLTTKEPTFR
jgi:mannose/fructose/N-acetylgalactosamine-specific phosphotransferase system component IIC